MKYMQLTCTALLTRKQCCVGIVEAASRRAGHNSKHILKKGQCFGDKAILSGEPAQESTIAGSTLLLLTIAR